MNDCSRKLEKKLSANQANCIDALILCEYTKKPLVSFYEDKIKVHIDSGKGLSKKKRAALIILNLQENSNLLKFKYEQRRKR